MCLAQGPNTVTPVRLEPSAPRSRVKHSTIEPLRSQYVSFESKIRLYKIHASINHPRPCRNSAGHFITACTDDARVKVPSFQKVTFFCYNMKFSTETPSICFCLYYMKMFLTAVIKDEHASDDSLQSDSSFLLRNSYQQLNH